MTTISSTKCGKYLDGACLSLNRIRFKSNIVSGIAIKSDPTYWEVIDLFQDFYQALADYSLNNNSH